MNILVYIETRGGKVKPAGFEALSGARKLADLTGGELSALLVGDAVESLSSDLEKYGPDHILLAEHSEFAGYSPEGYREAVLSAFAECAPKIVIMTATSLGRDLAPTVAARLEAAFLPDCISMEYSEGRLTVNRPVYAGRCIMTLAATGWPVVMTLRPKAFLPVERDGVSVDVKKLDFNLDGKIRARLTEIMGAGTERLDVTEADIIVAGGRGMKEAENFKLIEDLASELGAAVGASRAVVDSEWRPHSEQIGQTGKVVSPTLYFAVGISGAIQHLAGMTSSKTIVAINKDSEAAIFKTADYGIVGDAMEVLPALTEAVKS